MGYHLVIVEGSTEQAFLSNVFKNILNFKKATVVNNPNHPKCIDPFWKPTIPNKIPDGDDFNNPVNIPKYFASSTGEQICLYSANGFENVCFVIDMLVKGLGTQISELSSLIVLVDSDDQKIDPFEDRFKPIQEKLSICFPMSSIANSPNILQRGILNNGVYIIPSHEADGTLDNILLECAGMTYPELFKISQKFVADAQRLNGSEIDADSVKKLSKASGLAKAYINSIASILKPGCCYTTSLIENQWLKNAEEGQSIKPLLEFLKQLFEDQKLTT